MATQLQFSSDARVLLFAPHPDDESLACGVLLQRAAVAHASIQVVYATDGEDNPWPQRVLDRKWRLHARDRIRWGKMRRAEALAALRVLGLRETQVQFLGLPDQRLTTLLKRCRQSLLKNFADIISETKPTHLFIPSIADTHPDHSALAVMLRLVLQKCFCDSVPMSTWSYVVHGKSNLFHNCATALSQSDPEIARKRLAIACHKSQIKLSRRRFFSYAKRPEEFLPVSCPLSAGGSIIMTTRRERMLQIELRIQVQPLRADEPTLFLLGIDANGRADCHSIEIPITSGAAEIIDSRTGHVSAIAQYRGNKFAGELAVPIDAFSSEYPLFVKLERRSWFFDEAGWIEIPTVISPQLIPSQNRALPNAILVSR